MPRHLEDTPAHPSYPGSDGHMAYGEGRLMGYRGFDAAGTEPHYPFGHGTSYATFDWGPPAVTGRVAAGDLSPASGELVVRMQVTNTSTRPGSDVVQVYAHEPGHDADVPPQELVGFAKVRLDAGQAEEVAVPIGARELATWDVASGGWTIRPTLRQLRVARSSRDVVSTVEVTPA